MAVSMRSLRWGLVVAGVLLVVTLAGYVGYARRRAKEFLHDLPKQLGMDITQETDHFTYSQSLQGKTVFTVRAAKALQHKNGVVTLRDVGITLYGADGTRADQIHGQEFEYDQPHGTLRSVGEALIDLGPPGKQVADEAHMIHVKTSGLTFHQAEGTAETEQAIQFAAHGMVGEAMGAAYNSKTNVLILQSAVKLSGTRGTAGRQRPLTVTAARAEFERAQDTVLLDAPRYVSAGEAGAQTMSAARAVVHISADDKPKDVEAQGRVQLAGAGKGTIVAERLDMTLNDAGQPRDAHLYGGVRFADDSPTRQEQGRAQDARVAFDGEGRARHADITGAVQLDEAAGPSSRRLDAERLTLELTGGGKQKPALTGAVASGGDGARLYLVDSGNGTTPGTTRTGLRADRLTGSFGPLGLSGLDGAGRTSFESEAYDAKGQLQAKETSTGDTLAVTLRQGAKGRMEVSRAIQRGLVQSTRFAAAKKPGAADEREHARAATGDYDAVKDTLTLTGDAEVSDATSSISADRVALDRTSGDAQADGAVRVSYIATQPDAEPVHVLAAHAVTHKATSITEFTAAPGAKVRMWQGGSQVEAGVIDINRAKKTLLAHGTGANDPAAVKTLLVNASAKDGKKAQPPARVLSREMTYTDASRQVEFSGHVQVLQAEGTLHAQEVIAYLSPAAAAGAKADANLFAGKLERVAGTGEVELDGPGRKATGEKLLYSVADGTYVLTGTPAVPPRLTDAERGTVTGAQLRFRSGDDSVEVLGGVGAAGGRVRSEPRTTK